jgi:hypothetical protein
LFDFGEGAVGGVFRFTWCVFVGMRMGVLVMVIMVMIVIVIVIMLVLVIMFVFVVVRMAVVMMMFVIVFQVNVKLRSGDSGFFLARDVEVIALDPQFLQFVFELMRIDAKVEQRTQKHIAADAAEDIEVKDFHKFQAPSIKLQRNFKLQNSKRSTVRVLGAWRLEFLWSWELGIWRFIYPLAH